MHGEEVAHEEGRGRRPAEAAERGELLAEDELDEARGGIGEEENGEEDEEDGGGGRGGHGGDG